LGIGNWELAARNRRLMVFQHHYSFSFSLLRKAGPIQNSQLPQATAHLRLHRAQSPLQTARPSLQTFFAQHSKHGKPLDRKRQQWQRRKQTADNCRLSRRPTVLCCAFSSQYPRPLSKRFSKVVLGIASLSTRTLLMRVTCDYLKMLKSTSFFSSETTSPFS